MTEYKYDGRTDATREYELLTEFAAQFHPDDTRMRSFLSDELLDWFRSGIEDDEDVNIFEILEHTEAISEKRLEQICELRIQNSALGLELAKVTDVKQLVAEQGAAIVRLEKTAFEVWKASDAKLLGLREQLQEKEEDIWDLANKQESLRSLVADRDQVILELKAQLYDWMIVTGEEEDD